MKPTRHLMALPHLVALSLTTTALAASAPAGSAGIAGETGALSGGVSSISRPCTITYQNGSRQSVLSCSTNAGELCCGYDEWESGANCKTSCSCQRTGEREVTVVDESYPTLLRGVPVLFQYDTKPTRSAYAPVGCGAVAVAELMLWYHGLGWTDLAGDSEVSGLIDWEALAGDLSSGAYLSTWIRNNASPTFTSQVQRGIEDFVNDRGYDVEVAHYEVKDEASGDAISAVSAMGHIVNAVSNGRPVVIGYDVDYDAGGGIGGGGDDLGFIDHYGLVVGFDESTDPPQIIINVGWGATGSSGHGYTETYDFVIGSGKIHLWTVRLEAAEKDLGSGVCPADSWDGLYDPLSEVLQTSTDTYTAYVGVTFASSGYDDYPVAQRFMAGERCDAIGGEVSHVETETYSYTESASCSTLYAAYQSMKDGTFGDDVDLGLDDGEIPDPIYP